MTQHADPRLPLVAPTVDAETSGPDPTVDGTPAARTAGWPPSEPGAPAAPLSPPVGIGPMPAYPTPPYPTAPAPQPPLNTLSWVSVVVAFVASPVAIVLGLVARRQIARTGERGRGLALLGTILGAVFTAIGIATTVLVLVLATTFSASVAASTTPSATDTAGPPAPAAANDDYASGQAQLVAGFIQVGAAADTMSSALQTHRGDLGAIQGDFTTYRDAIVRFRTTEGAANLSPEVRQKVDADLVPATDRVLADLDTLSSSSDQSRLSSAADALETDSQAMVTAATAAMGG
jgi:Domain of unknown function (DUF4190)